MTESLKQKSVERLKALNQERLERLKARQSLIGFTEYTLPKYKAAPHHKIIAEHLEAVVRNDINRLMIFAPPRHGKSELASVRLPAWYIGLYPHREVFSAGYGENFAHEWGRFVRNCVAGPDFARCFPGVSLALDSQAAGRWHTQQGGAYRAAGAGTGITGRGANLFIIDDPIKGHVEAESQTVRDSRWQWYLSDVYTRLEDPHAIVLIQTRWHWDDLAGRLLNQESSGGDKWTVVEFPAINKAGEALWPEKYPIARLEQIRAVEGPRNWSSLYQQRPTPDEGGYFERQYFAYYDDAPPLAHLQLYGASDYAVSEDHGDWTVHIVVGVAPNSDLYVLDLWRQQANTLAWVETLFSLVNKYKAHLHVWAEEEDQIKKSVGPFINKLMAERSCWFTRYQLPTQGGARDGTGKAKQMKARSLQARMQQRKVLFPRGAPWLADLETELLQFPAGVHDDQVDALANIGRVLDQMADGRVPKSEAPPSWRIEGQGKGETIRLDFGAIDKDLNIFEKR
jgi:predicted phage terminase large subunit-like protein